MIVPRSQKQIELTKEARAALGIEETTIDPISLISAILKAPVDLLWFGGIGTYIKASHQTNAQVGDPANDVLRVDARDVRAKVIGEGANLAINQAARIEYATHAHQHWRAGGILVLRGCWWQGQADRPAAMLGKFDRNFDGLQPDCTAGAVADWHGVKLDFAFI